MLSVDGSGSYVALAAGTSATLGWNGFVEAEVSALLRWAHSHSKES